MHYEARSEHTQTLQANDFHIDPQSYCRELFLGL